YFGGTEHRSGKMVRFTKKDVAKYSPEQKEKLRQAMIAVSAEAQLPSQVEADQHDAALIQQGRALFAQNEVKCTECHEFHKKDETAEAPDLTGYGSRRWLISFISNPTNSAYYGEHNDRMPAFRTKEKEILSAKDIGLIADWLRGAWYEPGM